MRRDAILLLALLAACAVQDPASNDEGDGASLPALPKPGVTQPVPSEQPALSSDAGVDGQVATPASWRAQVIYLVMPDRFRNGDTSNDDLGSPDCFAPTDPQRYHGGDLEGIRQSIPYLKELGVTAVWTTPIYKQIGRLADGRCGYHGYWADYVDPYDDAMEPKLGTPADLQHLISDLHASNLRLVLDMVVNHTGDTATLPTQHPDWFHDPATCQSLGDPTIYCPLDRHPDFVQEKPEVASYLSNVAAHWTGFGIDGIRMDTAKHVPASYFTNSFFPAVRAVKPDLFTVGEVFDEGSLEPAKPYIAAGFGSVFHFPLRRALVDGIAKGGSVDLVAAAVETGIAKVGAQKALDLVIFADNHDVPRIANEPGLGVSEAEIRRRVELVYDLVFTLPGIPQLYSGDELAMYGGADPDNRRDLPVTTPTTRGEVFGHVAKLAKLRTTVPALAEGEYRELWRQNGGANVYAFSRGTGNDARIVVVNDGGTAVTTQIPVSTFPANTALVDELADGAPAATTLAGGKLAIALPARSAAIYRRGP